MLHRIFALALAWFFLAWPALPARAQLTSEAVTVDVRPGVTMRYLAITGAEPPVATAVLFSGGNGALKLSPKGEFGGTLSANFLIRTREDFARQRLFVAAVDAASDHAAGMDGNVRNSPTHAQDIGKVLSNIMTRTSAPLWLIGTSAGTMSAANAAARLAKSQSRPHGLVLTSPQTTLSPGQCGKSVYDAPLAAIEGPVLIVSHREDACPCSPGTSATADRLMAALTHAAPKENRIFTGGKPPLSGPCDARAPHGYFGIEDEVVNFIVDWIKGH